MIMIHDHDSMQKGDSAHNNDDTSEDTDDI